MPTPAIVHSKVSVDLKPAPINPNWILDGTPTARNAELSRSFDGTATTLIWDCSPGKFEWFYDRDETIHILQGCVVLNEGTRDERRIGPGDVVFFPAGSHARWHVEAHVRKLAFFRRALPRPLALLVNLLRQMKRGGRADAGPMDVATPGFALASPIAVE